MPGTFKGFVVHAHWESARSGPRIYLFGRLESGETFAVVETREFPGFFVRRSELDRALGFLGAGCTVEEKAFVEGPGAGRDFSTLDGEGCVRLKCDTVPECRRSAASLAENGVRTYEADLRFTDQYLMARGVHGPLLIRGEPRSGRRVGLVFVDPEVGPAEWHPSLSVLSLDIETDPAGGEIYAVGLAFGDPRRGGGREEVLFNGRSWADGSSRPGGAPSGDPLVSAFPDERAMLEAFLERVARWDPDVFTGWNVIDFDFRVMAGRFGHYGVPFRIGRSDAPASYLPGERGGAGAVFVPGRQAVDAMRVARASQWRFEDYTLETVATAVLGRGKALELGPGEGKSEAVARMYEEDPESLSRYCLEDARLVLEILERTGLFELTVRRAALAGVSLDRAWTSVHAFERLYIEALHTRGYLAPSLGVDPFPELAARGGTILGPWAGLYDNVVAFDFRSLYPSIIRTFNIDPLSFVRPAASGGSEAAGGASGDGPAAGGLTADRNGGGTGERLVRAPNGALFRHPATAAGRLAILPGILDRFFEERRRADERGDESASRVYKTIMNSFYGVLGARGSRFASGYLSGAITGFGHSLMAWCERWFEERGFRVLYGDTDSLFVLSGLPAGTPGGELERLGRDLCGRLNADLAVHVAGAHGVESRLELEFEKVYFRFFIPPVRGREDTVGGGRRGRAKGYAGLTVPVSELAEAVGSGREPRGVEVVGMEAVRRDWTDLARGFQMGLLSLLFAGAGPAAAGAFAGKTVKSLREGALDGKLVYRKALRKPLGDYARSAPPHAKAAGMLDAGDRRGLIRYVWTREGPQPEGKVTSPPDYDHYVEKQLVPIAAAFSEALGIDARRLFGGEGQLDLF